MAPFASWAQNPPVSPQFMRTICQRVQLMGDNANMYAVTGYLEQVLTPLGFKRISTSETEWVYGKDVALKEIPGGFIYDFQTNDASVLQVAAYGRVTADLLFKNSGMKDYFRQAIPLAGFVNPVHEGKPEVFVQVGGQDDFLISSDGESGVTTVTYRVALPTVAPDMLAPADVIAMVGMPLEEAKQNAMNTGYQHVLTNGITNYLLLGCQLEGETSPYKYKPLQGNEDIPYSALILNADGAMVKNARLNIYHCDENIFLYDLARAGFHQQSQKGKLRRFESDIQQKRATLERLGEDAWTIFIEKK